MWTKLELALILVTASAVAADGGWKRHIIDGSSQGADGVRLADANGDGLLDIATGWEEGGKVRIYFNPGPREAVRPWPAATIGSVPSPEDAVFVDLDGDGALDVVSSTEGNSQTLFVHWARNWLTQPLVTGRQWMFALPFDMDGDNGIDLVVGSKNEDAIIGWLESPRNPRDVAAWSLHRLYKAGWIMSLIARDMDADGDLDVLATDRRGPRRGALWLENPSWQEHRIGPLDAYEAMFAAAADLNGDKLEDVVVASREPNTIQIHRRMSVEGLAWSTSSIPLPEGAGTGKGVAIGDLDLDGRMDIAFTCENAVDGREGVMWLSYDGSPFSGHWQAHSISGPEGIKFDRIELLDLDRDGDLDLITCEERDNLGVIWYENPTR